MSKTYRNTKSGQAKDRRLSVRVVRRYPPDFRKLGRAVIRLAAAQEEADALAASDALSTAQDARSVTEGPKPTAGDVIADEGTQQDG